MRKQILVGIDFGSDSVRTLLCDAQTGNEISCGVSEYSRWKEKLYCIPVVNQYRQHALDYTEGLTWSFEKALNEAYPEAGDDIIGIAVDTTGSTPCPVDKLGNPLCLLDRFTENPNAMFHLWKDHTAVDEAKEINSIFSGGEIDFTKYQGVYSSEWYWAKILHTIRMDPNIRKYAYTWIEHSDWIAGLLTGFESADDIIRGSCAAGHKALWNSEFEGLPSREILANIDPYLAIVSDRYAESTAPAGTYLGRISVNWAQKLNINPAAIIGMGSFDAHAGGVGAGIERKTMVKVIGTSTVDLAIENPEILLNKDLREICGQAEDSIIPGYMGLEMGQPSFGDSYSWLRSVCLWPLRETDFPDEIATIEKLEKIINFLEKDIIRNMEEKAQNHVKNAEVVLDWFNGRRYPSLNENVKSVFANISLGTDLPAIFCAIVKGTVFGSRRIFESLIQNGIEIDKIIAVGGIAEKSTFVMQMLADVMKIPIYICREKQVCAKGAVIYASVAAGIFKNIPAAQKKYCHSDESPFLPDKSRGTLYDKQYQAYLKSGELSEYFAEK